MHVVQGPWNRSAGKVGSDGDRLSLVVDDRIEVDWETSSMAPLGGMRESLRIEDWFAEI